MWLLLKERLVSRIQLQSTNLVGSKVDASRTRPLSGGQGLNQKWKFVAPDVLF